MVGWGRRGWQHGRVGQPWLVEAKPLDLEGGCHACVHESPGLTTHPFLAGWAQQHSSLGRRVPCHFSSCTEEKSSSHPSTTWT